MTTWLRESRARLVTMSVLLVGIGLMLLVAMADTYPWLIRPLIAGLWVGGAGTAWLGVRLRTRGSDENKNAPGELLSDAGTALATSAAVGTLLFFATENLESTLFDRDTRADGIRFVREVATQREPNVKAFAGLDLRGAHLADLDLSNARLSGAHLEEADLTGANLSNAMVVNAQADGATLVGAILRNADLTQIDLRDAALDGADLSPTYLGGAILRDADLDDATLGGADLQDADLRDADLSRADLTGTDLSAADLRDADLEDSVLIDAFVLDGDLRLTDAELHDADLTGAYLADVDFANADLRGACLQGADLTGADLDEAVLDDVAYDQATRWPEGYEPPATADEGAPDEEACRGDSADEPTGQEAG